MSDKSIIHRPLIPSGTNMPIDARCRVDRFDQIADIENPYIGLHIYVVSTGKEYIVRALLPKEIGGISVSYGKIDIPSLLEAVRDVDLEHYLKKEEANTAFVQKEEGKRLSTNDFTSDEKSKLEGIEPKANVNIIERILLNGEEITPSKKGIALTDIQRTMRAGNGIAIADNTISCTIDTTLFKVVDSIPSGAPSDADKSKIHLVRNDQSSGDNLYDEYLWNGSKWEKLGEFKAEIDLTPYIKKTEANDTFVVKEAGKGLSTNDFTNDDKDKVGQIPSIAERTAQNSGDIERLIDAKDSLGNSKAISLDTEEWPTLTGLPVMIVKSGAPAEIPSFIGQRYLDTANKKAYLAFGVSAVSDWVVMN